MPMLSAVAAMVPPSRSVCPTSYYFPPQCVEDIYAFVQYVGTGSSQTFSTNGVNLLNTGGWLIQIVLTSDSAGQEMVWFDSVMGVGKYFQSSGVQTTDATTLTAITSTSFTIGTSSLINTNGRYYAANLWKKHPFFFDIVSYTGTGSTQKIYHNLYASPQIAIIKNRTSGNLIQANYQASGTPSSINCGDMNTTTPYGVTTNTTWVNDISGQSPVTSSDLGLTFNGYVQVVSATQTNANASLYTLYVFGSKNVFGTYPNGLMQAFNASVIVNATQYNFQRNTTWAAGNFGKPILHQLMMTFPSNATSNPPTMGNIYNRNIGYSNSWGAYLTANDSYYGSANATSGSGSTSALRGWADVNSTDTGFRESPTVYAPNSSNMLCAVVADRTMKPTLDGSSLHEFKNANNVSADFTLTTIVPSMVHRVNASNSFSGTTDRHDGLGTVDGRSNILRNGPAFTRTEGIIGQGTSPGQQNQGCYQTFGQSNWGGREYGFFFRYALDALMPFVYYGDGASPQYGSVPYYDPTGNNAYPCVVCWTSGCSSSQGGERWWFPALSPRTTKYFLGSGVLTTSASQSNDFSYSNFRPYAVDNFNNNGTTYRGFAANTITGVQTSGTYTGNGAYQNVNLGLTTPARFLFVAASNNQNLRMYSVGNGISYCGIKQASGSSTVLDVLQYDSGNPAANSSGIALTDSSPINQSGVTFYYWAIN